MREAFPRLSASARYHFRPMRALRHLRLLFCCLLLNLLGLPHRTAAQRPATALNMSLLGRWGVPQFDPSRDRYNDIWGYAAPDGREYALIGSGAGTHVVEVSDPRAPRWVQTILGRSNSGWRDYKTYSHYAYAVAGDLPRQSLQILDLQYLPDSVHVVMDNDTISPSTHTCFIEGDRLYLASVQRPQEFLNWHFVDIYSLADPVNPRRLHHLNLQPYSGGAHAVFARRDILYVSGEYGGLFIFDVRQPTAPRLLTNLRNYAFSGYNHSNWTTTNGKLLVTADELKQGLPLKIFELSNLTQPRLLSTFNSYPLATPHNPYIIGDRYVVSSCYQDGVQVWDIADPLNPVRVGFFDTCPENDSSDTGMRQLSGGNSSNSGRPTGYGDFWGCWGVYPFLPSGNIIASDMQHGLFVLSPPYSIPIEAAAPPPPAPPAPITPIGLWPNPASAEVWLSLRYPSELLTVEIIDALGRVVRPGQSWSAPKAPVQLITQGLAPGTYWLRVTRPNEVTRMERLIITL